jgi:hypothetical protein
MQGNVVIPGGPFAYFGVGVIGTWIVASCTLVDNELLSFPNIQPVKIPSIPAEIYCMSKFVLGFDDVSIGAS